MNKIFYTYHLLIYFNFNIKIVCKTQYFNCVQYFFYNNIKTKNNIKNYFLQKFKFCCEK